MRKFLEELSRKMDVDPSNNEIVAAFEPRCRIVISNMKQFFAEQQPLYSNGAPFSGEVVGLLCTMSVRLSQKALFLDILSFDFLKMPRPSQSYPSFFQAIGMGLAVFGLEMLEPK